MSRQAFRREYGAAGVVILLGLTFAGLSLNYPLGTMLRPGPGVFPLGTGIFLAMLGLGVAMETWISRRIIDEGPADEGAPPPSRVAWRALLAVVAGILAFAFLVDRVGYVAAAIALVGISGLGEVRQSHVGLIGVALFMVIFGVTVFIWGLGVPMPVVGAR